LSCCDPRDALGALCTNIYKFLSDIRELKNSRVFSQWRPTAAVAEPPAVPPPLSRLPACRCFVSRRRSVSVSFWRLWLRLPSTSKLFPRLSPRQAPPQDHPAAARDKSEVRPHAVPARARHPASDAAFCLQGRNAIANPRKRERGRRHARNPQPLYARGAPARRNTCACGRMRSIVRSPTPRPACKHQVCLP